MAKLFESVRYLKGVGKARAELFASMGITTLYDLISYFPRTYEDRSRIVPISELQVDEPACFRAFVTSNPRTHHIRKGLDLTKLTVADDTARLNLTFFNQTYVAENLEYSREYYFYGTLNGDYMGYQVTNPIFEPVEKPGVLTRRIMPIYPLTAGMCSRPWRPAWRSCRSCCPENSGPGTGSATRSQPTAISTCRNPSRPWTGPGTGWCLRNSLSSPWALPCCAAAGPKKSGSKAHCARELEISEEELVKDEENPKLKKIIIDDLNNLAIEANFNGLEKVKFVLLTFEGFTINNECMTPTMKIVRKKVEIRYKNRIEKLFSIMKAKSH